MYRGDHDDHQWCPKAGVEERDSILYCSKSPRSLPSKLRPLDAEEIFGHFLL